MSLALHHRSCCIFVVVVLFCSLLRKGSFKVQYLLIVLKVAIVRTMVQMTSTDRQADHNLSKLKTIQQFIFLVLESFKTLSPELTFSWLESKYTNLSSGQTEILIITTDQMNVSQRIYCFHIMRWNFLAWKSSLNTKCPFTLVRLRSLIGGMGDFQNPWEGLLP